MATTTHDPRNEEVPLTNTERFALHVKENATMYIASIVIVLVVFVGAALFRANTDMKNREQSAAFASALKTEDPLEKVAALGAVADSGSKFSTEALYLEGFTALRVEDYEGASAAFSKLRMEHPDFKFTPDAVEGMGLAKMAQGDFAGAIALFQEVTETWPDSFAALRQPYNIAQCHEKDGDLEAAATSYREQMTKFPESNVATRAETELNRLVTQNPELNTDDDLNFSLPTTP